jgi:hypothetical protein
MAVTIRTVRKHNPNFGRGKAAKRPNKSGAKAPKRPNPGYLAVVGPINPNKGGTMRTKAMKSKHPHRAKSASAGRKQNPFNKPMARGKRRKQNPGYVKTVSRIVMLGFWALVGLVLTRQLPQMLLGPRNTGFVGYLANIGVAAGASMIALRVAGEDAATGMAVGGGVYVVNRGIQEHLSPIGKYLSLSGLGDAMALGDLVEGDEAYRPFPVVYNQDGQPWIPPQIDARRAMAMIEAAKAAAVPSGMGHLSHSHLAA